ncbi:MAG: endonuclease, partial [Muribaculaceae bacterium]|nr:endonuclease [Muribaculaceae bacterium]
MKLHSLILLTTLGGLALTSAAAAPDTYYSSLEGYRGTTLRKAAKSIVRNHTVISYGNQTWEAFYVTDTRIVNGKLCWWDMYSPNDVLASSPGSHSGMNIEHTIPNSWWGGTKNDAYKDLYELNPSDSKANSAKSNYPYGEIEGSYHYDNGVTFVGHPKSGQTGSSQGNWCYEPLDEYKGDFARSLFYMYTVYDDIAWSSSTAWMYTVGSDKLLQDWAIEMLLRWSKEDPVSEKEIARNEAVYGIQHNRNPYIDLPGLEDFVWGNKRNVDFSLEYIEHPDIPVIPS